MNEPYEKPLPEITPLDRPFWDHALRGEFALHSCDSCGDAHFPAAPICSQCLGTDLTWRVASGKGLLESWVTFHRAYWKSYENDLPYTVAIVRLDEGPLFVANLMGDVEAARLGAPVEVVFEAVTPEISLPKVRLSP